MRKALQASVLMIALAIPAFAGDIPYNVTSSSEVTVTELLITLLSVIVR